MRTFLTFLFICAIICMTYFVYQQQGQNNDSDTLVATTIQDVKQVDKLAEKHEPYDMWAMQRSYPDQKLDLEAYRGAIQKAQRMAKEGEKTKGSTVPWVVEGPTNIEGRINTVAVHPDDPQTVYLGCSRGGIFKTTDGGENWTPIFDEQSLLTIGHILLAPSDPEIVYVATGDPNISGHFAVGDGLYRSKDGGATWESVGLNDQWVLSRVLLHPTDPDVIYVASMGEPQSRGTKRGLYKTIDGGATWEQILQVSEEAGIIDMVMNPKDPDVIYAAGWNRIRNWQESMTFGLDGKIFKTTDGGANWTQLKDGLPDFPVSRIGLTIHPSQPDTVYAVYVDTTHQLQGVYKTLDGGAAWEQIARSNSNGMPNNLLGGFGWYFGKIRLNPYRPEEIYVLGVDLVRSIDGGANWDLAAPISWTGEVHADKHDLFFINADSMVLATDGGLYFSKNNSVDWIDWDNLPNTQFYRLAVNPHQPGTYMAGAQDNGTSWGNQFIVDGWTRVYGADGFQPTFHPTDPDIYYAETQRGGLVYTKNGGASFSGFTNGITDERIGWDAPYIMSSEDPDLLYYGGSRVFRDTLGIDGRWHPISEDLTDGDIFGGAFHFISSLSESVVNTDYLYAGTSDANVWRSLDKGETWEDISEGIPERYITSVKASPVDENTVYVTSSGFKGNGYLPHVHRSIDNGDTWEDISSDLPPVGVNDIVILPEDQTESTLFVATDVGVYYTEDAGESWARLGTDMPFIHIFDMEYEAVTRKLVVATFARSIQSIDLKEVIDYGQFIEVGVTAAELVKEGGFEVYPNPVVDVAQIKLTQAELLDAGQLSLQISTIDGRILSTQAYHNTLELGDLPTGMYLVTLTDRAASKRWVQRVIKQ